jgi:hypothetical protein
VNLRQVQFLVTLGPRDALVNWLGLNNGNNRQNHSMGKPNRVCVFNANHRGMGLKTRV